MEPYIYNAFIERVIDGDTFVAKVDVGFDLTLDCRIRLYGINTPEIRGSEKEKGIISSKFVSDLIEGKQVMIKSQNKRDSFGRWLATIVLEDNTDLGDAILDNKMGEIMILSINPSLWQRFTSFLKKLFN